MHYLTGRGGPEMTRRRALLALSATMVSPSLMAQRTIPMIQTRRLNNVMIAVSNLERSRDFYEKLLGPPVRQGDTIVFRLGEGPTSLLFNAFYRRYGQQANRLPDPSSPADEVRWTDDF